MPHRSISDAAADLLCCRDPARQKDPAAERGRGAHGQPEQNQPGAGEDGEHVVEPEHLKDIFRTVKDDTDQAQFLVDVVVGQHTHEVQVLDSHTF